MKYGYVSGINKRISRLVQGCIMLREDAMEEGFALLDAVYDCGVNCFDTAYIYGEGAVDRVLGAWVRTRDLEKEAVIIAKGAHHDANGRRVTPKDLTSDLLEILERMQLERIDLYMLHRDDPLQPVGPIIEELNRHLEAGRISAFGGSNWTHRRIEEANEYAYKKGLVPFAASSPNFSLAEQVESPWRDCVSISGPGGKEARSWYGRMRFPLFTWSSLACGFFSGLVKSRDPEGGKRHVPEHSVRAYWTEDNFRRLARVESMAARKGMTVSQIATAWIINQPLDIFALVGHRNRAECEANVAAMNLQLSPAESAWLDLEADDLEAAQRCA